MVNKKTKDKLFTVKYSQKLDLDNYINRIWKHSWVDYGDKNKEYFYRRAPKEFVDNLMDAPNKKAAKKVVLQYWKETLHPSFERDNEFLCKWFEMFLNGEKDRVISRLEKVYKNPFPFDKITVYLTTCFFNPYNYDKRYFMISRTDNFFGIFTATKHELNHFMFYYYFQDYLNSKGATLEQTEYLKEALAILTSGRKSENVGRNSQILRIEDYVKENRDLSVKEIVDKVIEKKFFI